MSVITAEQFRNNYTANPAATDPRTQYAINRATKRLIHYVGQIVVNDYLSETPDNAARADDLWHAHGHFAYAILAGTCGSTLREGGKLKREEGVMGNTTAEYETFKEVEGWIDYQNGLAMELLAPYLTPAAEDTTNLDEPMTTFHELEIVF